MKAPVFVVACLVAHMALGQAEPVVATRWSTDAPLPLDLKEPGRCQSFACNIPINCGNGKAVSG